MSLKSNRNQVAAALTAAGVPAFDHLPARISPPCAVIAGADPYLTKEGAPIGGVRVRLEVRLMVRPGANDVVVDDLDDLIETVYTTVENTTWAVRDVSQPYSLVVGQSSFLAVTVTIDDDIKLIGA